LSPYNCLFLFEKYPIMELSIRNQWFVVCGAGRGFGRAIAEKLLSEGALVLAIARTQTVLDDFQQQWPGHLHSICGDITRAEVQQMVMEFIDGKTVSGLVVNAGGPPAKSFLETELTDWDNAWMSLVRWKIALTMQFIPVFRKQQYGRLVFIESVSVKQPIENLVLSNSLRLAVVGFVKSLAKEVAAEHITLNVLAPGYHNTAAMKRLFQKKADISHISVDEAKKSFEALIPVGTMGEAFEMAELATWLLSPNARYVTGQTISHDGGVVHGLFG